MFVWYSVSSFCFSSKDTSSSPKLTYKIDTGLKNITTSIQKFAEIVVESKPCEMVFVRRKDKEAQMMVAELSLPMSVENIQLNLKQKINTKVSHFLTFYIYYSYTSATSTSRRYSNAIVIFNVNCIKSTGSCFIFTYREYTCLQSLVNSDSLNQTKLTYKIDTGLKNITTSIQKFAEVV
jgi:hypothetical protein